MDPFVDYTGSLVQKEHANGYKRVPCYLLFSLFTNSYLSTHLKVHKYERVNGHVKELKRYKNHVFTFMREYKNHNLLVRLKIYMTLVFFLVLCSVFGSLSVENTFKSGSTQKNSPLHKKLSPLVLPFAATPPYQAQTQIFMVEKLDDPNHLSRTPNSTPKKKIKSRVSPISASQPALKTQSPFLTPGEKLSRRFRTYSQTSLSDVSHESENSVTSSKRGGQAAKRITKDGKYFLDARKKQCTLQYIEEYLDVEQAERLQNEVNKVLSEHPMSKIKTRGPSETSEFTLKVDEDGSLLDVSSPSDPLHELISFQTKNMQSALKKIFHLDTSISKVLIRKLPNYLDFIPYESLLGMAGSNPVVAALSLGAPRLMKIRKGSKVTHVVSLHSGSLCVMSGNTTMNYSHSIPKGQVHSECEQMILFFVGTPSSRVETSDSELSSASSANPGSSTDGGETSTADEQSESEVESVRSELTYPSLFDNILIPKITVTETSTEHALTSKDIGDSEELMSDILKLDEEKSKMESHVTEHTSNLSPNPTHTQTSLKLEERHDVQTGGLHTPEECEQTMIHVLNNTPAAETIDVCVHHLPEQVLSDELRRNGCSTDGTIDERRTRMALLLNHQVKPAPALVTQQQDLIPSLSCVQTMLENTQLDIKEEIRHLADEMARMRIDTSKPDLGRIEKLLEDNKKVTKNLNDAWEKNLASTSKIKNSIDRFFCELGIAEQRCDELDKSLKTLKCDLKTYCNSAFFKEDSELIKEMHTIVTRERPQPREQTASPPELVPVESLRSSTNQPGPSVSQRPSSARSSSPTPRHQHQSISPPSYSNVLQSRRGTGFSMTDAAHRPSNAQTQVIPPSHATPPTPQPTPPSETTPPASEPLQSRNGTTRQFQTVLITDSILRHVGNMDTENVLGVNHRLRLVNKRDSSGLHDQKMKTSLFNMEPDFIYLHLGVNDVHQNFTLKESLANFYSFITFTKEYLPRTKLFISLPLMTGDDDANTRIDELREAIHLYVSIRGKDDERPLKERVLFMNPNNNFMKNGLLVPEFYHTDLVHPSSRGKAVILGNMRHSIHEMTRIILNKPKRIRSPSQRQPGSGAT